MCKILNIILQVYATELKYIIIISGFNLINKVGF